MAATYRNFTGNLDATATVRYLRSVNVAENAATPAAAKVFLRDGVAGNLVVDIRLAAGESKHLSFNPPLYFPLGVQIDVGGGTVRGSIDGE